MPPEFRTRFAPSPTGPLHLGHAFSALLAHDMAQRQGGQFLLRIEDIDRARARPEWEQQIYHDLRWLGLSWPEPVMRQSDRQSAYQAALDRLWATGLIYPCFCNRNDIRQAMEAPQEGVPTHGPDGIIYPGLCRPAAAAPRGARPGDQTLRLNLMQITAEPWRFTEGGQAYAGLHIVTPDHLAQAVGDIVVARRDIGTSYHLSAVLDDAAQGITDVVRGEDLFDATKIQVVLQKLLQLPTPSYHHHRLIRDAAGKRLAKRDDARALSLYRAEGASPQDIRRMVGL